MEHDNKIEITDELITSYITGNATPDEAIAIAGWLEDPGNKKKFGALESAWLKTNSASVPSFEADAGWAHVGERLISPHNRPSMIALVMRVAATVMIIAVVGALVFRLGRHHDVPYATLMTTTSSQEFAFEDRSTVTLYRNSAIDYPEHFQERSREVRLKKGEAFFKVAPDRSKPFIVHTDVGDIEVVGTEFDVVVGADGAEVNVREGKVKVYQETDTVMLAAGQSAKLISGEDAIAINQVADVNVWGYATQTLVFNDVPLKAAIESIEKAYPCRIRLSGSNIDNCRLTATFENDAVDKIVNLVADILNLTVTKNGETFTLEGQGCP